MKAHLSIVKGKDKGKSFYVVEGKPITLGRSSAADISLSEPRISRIHCRFTHDGKHIMLTDLNSTNGTYVNERKIKSVPLTDDDEIRIGETVITVALERGAEGAGKGPARETAEPVEAERPKRPAAVGQAEAPPERRTVGAGESRLPPERSGEEEPARRMGGRKEAPGEGSVMGLFDKWLDEPEKQRRGGSGEERGTARREPRGPAKAGRTAPSTAVSGIPGVEIGRKTGEDALGDLYEGSHLFLSRPVVLRVLSGAAALDDGNVRDFVEVGRANASANHPGILQIYDGGKGGDVYYVVQESPEGMTVEALLSRDENKRLISLNIAVDIALQLARALRRAHSIKLVHWDLRPGSVYVSRERVAKIGGFKFPATIVRTAAGAGEMTSKLPVTPYVAPELIHDIDIADFRADVYGVCAVLYEMICGKPPFAADSDRALIEKILRTRPETPQKHNPSLPPDLCLLALKGLAKDPSNRFPTAGDLVKEIKALPAVRAEEE